MAIDTQARRVVYFAPSLHTTQGHAAIGRAMGAVFAQIPHWRVMPIYSTNMVMMNAMRQWSPDYFIADFPHTAGEEQIRELRVDPTLKGCMFIALRMYSPSEATPPPGMFDLLVELEPGACEFEDQTRVIKPGLLLNHAHLRDPSADEAKVWDSLAARGFKGKASRTLLVMQTGSPDEQLWLLDAAKHWASKQPTDYVIVPSLNLPQTAARFMAYASNIFAASGYSTTWEVVAHGRLPDTVFIHLDRPLENLGARMIGANRYHHAIKAARDESTLQRIINGVNYLAAELPRWALNTQSGLTSVDNKEPP
jgi:hypothetical protein